VGLPAAGRPDRAESLHTRFHHQASCSGFHGPLDAGGSKNTEVLVQQLQATQFQLVSATVNLSHLVADLAEQVTLGNALQVVQSNPCAGTAPLLQSWILSGEIRQELRHHRVEKDRAWETAIVAVVDNGQKVLAGHQLLAHGHEAQAAANWLRIPVLSAGLQGFVGLYGLAVQTRMLGVLYHRNRDRLRWF
jgi:hypothetical protein